MKELRTVRVCMLALLLCGSWQMANGSKGVEKAKTFSKRALTTLVAAGVFSGAILTAGAHEVPLEERQERLQQLQQEAIQQQQLSFSTYDSQSTQPPIDWERRLNEESEEENAQAWSEEVTLGSPVFYLAFRNSDYEHMHHATYVGNTATGEPMFAGIFLVGHEEDHITLWAHDGLVTQGFEQRDVKVFSDPLDLYAQVHVFTIKDLNLSDRYDYAVPEAFPVDDIGKELAMLQYAKRADEPNSYANLPLKQRSCEVLAANVWGELGIGRHTCKYFEESHSVFGAPIFDPASGKLVGFFSQTNPSGASLSEGMTQELVDFLLTQQTNPTAVDSKDKLAVTWAAIKRSR